ncbi:MAG: hypothetical protein AAF199_08335, partial [Pseudomonadota bacterium]
TGHLILLHLSAKFGSILASRGWWQKASRPSAGVLVSLARAAAAALRFANGGGQAALVRAIPPMPLHQETHAAPRHLQGSARPGTV